MSNLERNLLPAHAVQEKGIKGNPGLQKEYR